MNGVNATPDQVLVIDVAVIAFVAITIGYASVGALLAGRPGAGRIATLLLGGAVLSALVYFGNLVGGDLALADPGSTLFGVILLMGPVAIGPGFTTILPGLAIAFPDGRLPSPRWRWPVGLALAVVGVGTLLQLIRPGSIVGGPGGTMRNPFGIDALPATIGDVAELAVAIGIIGFAILGVTAVIVRYRRGDAAERQQQRWFVAAVSLAALPLALSALPWTGGPAMFLVSAVGLLLVPIAVGIAVTRYRLYEIDHLINRTLVYVPLTALLAGLYAAIVTLLQRVFESLVGPQSDAAVIISTLILVSVFTPLRKWLEGIVERRFQAPPRPRDDAPSSAEWEARVAAVALRVIRAELDARSLGEPPAASGG
jgi:hypothetical protein